MTAVIRDMERDSVITMQQYESIPGDRAYMAVNQ